MGTNKAIKDVMLKKYGKKCFIEELGLRTKEEIEADLARYKSSKRKELCMLTFHHIKERCKGGYATEENGAILRNINHIWFNGLSKERQEEINRLFQGYKARIAKMNKESESKSKKISVYFGVVGVTQDKSISIVSSAPGLVIEDFSREDDILTIPLHDDAEYEEYIALRRQEQRAKWRALGHGDDAWER